MKLTSAIILLASIASKAHAAGSLRSGSNTPGIDESEHTVSSAEGVLHMKENPNKRSLEGGNDRMANIIAAESASVGDLHAEEQREATREKKERMKALLDETTTTVGDIPSFEMKSKGAPTESYSEEAESDNSDIGILIVGGEASGTNEFPYYVNMNGCGGTLIGPNVVLSAGHCGSYLGQTVIIGSTRVTVVQSRRHPSFNMDTMEHDFFLHKLRSPVTTTGARVTLNSNGTLPIAGRDLTVLGLGLTSEGGRPSSSLRDVVIPAISNANCQAAYGSSEFKSSSMFCAGESGKDSCQGDSGGPIVIRNGLNHVLTGVVSWGYGCAQPEYPGVYARVSSAISWIKSVACTEWGSSVNGLCGSGTGSSPTRAPGPTPTSAPANRPAPTARPVASPTSGPCTTLTVKLRTDAWPGENFIELYNGRGSTIWDYSFSAKNTNFRFSKCIPDNGCTILDVTDTEGDGLLGSGHLTVMYGSKVMYDDWDIGYGVDLNLGDRC